MEYRYVTENNLNHRQDYMYSTYQGQTFLDTYFNNRRNYIKQWHSCDLSFSEEEVREVSETERKLKELSAQNIELANRFVKSFEVRKKLYDRYDWETWRPAQNAKYDNLELYLLLGEKLIMIYKKTGNLKFLNCLLKVNDTLLSRVSLLKEQQKIRLCTLIKQELDSVEALQRKTV